MSIKLMQTKTNNSHISVKDFGAVGDGVNDDQPAIQAALDSLTERGGKVVYLPAGVYKCSAPIKLGNSSILMGDGGMLETQATGGSPATLTYRPPTVLDFSGQDCDGVITDPDAAYRCQGTRVMGLLIKGSGTNNGKSGLRYYSASNASPASHRKAGLGYAYNVYIENFQTGVHFDTGDSCSFTYGHISNCKYAIQNLAGSECRVEKCSLWTITATVWLGSSGASRMRFIDNEIEPESASVDGCLWTSFTDGAIIGNTFRGPCRTGVEVNGTTRGLRIIGNEFHVNTYGLKFADTETTSAITVIGNTFRAVSSGTNAMLLRTAHATADMTVVGNVCEGTWTTHLVYDRDKNYEITNNSLTTVQAYSDAAVTVGTGWRSHGKKLYVASGDILTPRGGPTAVTTSSAGVIRVIPIELPTCTLDQIGIEITSGLASTFVRLGIYRSLLTGRPGELLVGTDQIDSSVTSVVTATISQAVKAGRYWLALVAQGGSPSVRVISAIFEQMPLVANPSGTLAASFITTETAAAGALPTTVALGGGVSSAGPRIFVRVA